jgi:lipoprotein NlpD
MLLVFVLLLAGCFKTELPVYSQHAYKKHTSHHSSSYTVRAGDTLYSIGRRFGIHYKTLARNNHIRYPYTIYKGQKIYLRGVAPRSHALPIAKKQYKKRHRKARKRASKVYGKKSHTSTLSASSYHLRWPVKGVLTSPFGRRGSRMHDGIDIGAKEGTRVYAAASGEVVYSDKRLSGYGNLIIIRHSHDLFTAYAHNQRNLVRKGMKVKAGDLIAKVGHTGHATGPHLHFEVRRGPTPVNPLAYLPKKR